MNTISGKIIEIESTKTYGNKGFQKRIVVIDTEPEGRYSNPIGLEFTGDENTRLPDAFTVGETLEAEFVLKGRKWQRDASSEVRYFLNAEVVKILSDHEDISQPTEHPAHADEQGDNSIPF